MHPLTNPELARLHIAELRRVVGLRSRRPSRRRAKQQRNALESSRLQLGSRDFYAWVLGLPWVVERPYELAPGVRTFAVDCPPLDIRRLWLVTGFGSAGVDVPQVSVIVPTEVSSAVEDAGWGRPIVSMPAGHVLMGIGAESASAPVDVEALVLTGYRYAMA